MMRTRIQIFLFVVLMIAALQAGGRSASISVYFLHDSQLTMPFAIFINSGRTLTDDENLRRDSEIMKQQPLFNIDDILIYAMPDVANFYQYFDSCSFLSLLKTGLILSGIQTTQPIWPAAIERIFKTRFYEERQIEPAWLVTAPFQMYLPGVDSAAIIQLIAKPITEEGYLFIHHSNDFRKDEFFLQVPAPLLKEFSCAEYLLMEHFIYEFLKSKLVRSRYDWLLNASPLERLSDRQIPVYLPDIHLEVDSSFVRQLVVQWQRFYPVLLQSVSEEKLQELQRDFRDKFELLTSSESARLTMIIKLLLRTGKCHSISELEESIAKIKLNEFSVKLRAVLGQKLLEKFWFTAARIDDELLQKFEPQFKFKLIQ